MIKLPFYLWRNNCFLYGFLDRLGIKMEGVYHLDVLTPDAL